MCSKVERLRAGAEDFLDKALGTDASLMFSPSQVSKFSFDFISLINWLILSH